MSVALLSAVSFMSMADAKGHPRYQRDPQTEHAIYDMLGEADRLCDAGRNLEAKNVLLRAAKFDPSANSANLHDRLARIYRQLGNLHQSIVESMIAMRFEPDDSRPMYDISVAYSELAKFDAAIEWAQKYIASNPPRARKEHAEKFIVDLQERKQEQGKKDPGSPDYLAQLTADDDAHPWKKDKLPFKLCIGDGTGMPGYNPAYRQVALDAVNSWVRASGQRLSYVLVNDPAQATLVLEWCLKINEGKVSKVHDKIGLTTYEGGEGEPWPIDSAKVQIRLLDPFTKKPIPEDEIKETCLHEFGHAFGLCGHSANPDDIMCDVENNRQLPGLTRRDKATIARLYAEYPVMQPQVQDLTQFGLANPGSAPGNSAYTNSAAAPFGQPSFQQQSSPYQQAQYQQAPYQQTQYQQGPYQQNPGLQAGYGQTQPQYQQPAQGYQSPYPQNPAYSISPTNYQQPYQH